MICPRSQSKAATEQGFDVRSSASSLGATGVGDESPHGTGCMGRAQSRAALAPLGPARGTRTLTSRAICHFASFPVGPHKV